MRRRRCKSEIDGFPALRTISSASSYISSSSPAPSPFADPLAGLLVGVLAEEGALNVVAAGVLGLGGANRSARDWTGSAERLKTTRPLNADAVEMAGRGPALPQAATPVVAAAGSRTTRIRSR